MSHHVSWWQLKNDQWLENTIEFFVHDLERSLHLVKQEGVRRHEIRSGAPTAHDVSNFDVPPAVGLAAHLFPVVDYKAIDIQSDHGSAYRTHSPVTFTTALPD
jgi:hypothetical protein